MQGKDMKSTSAGLFTGVLGASASSYGALCAGACGAACGTSALSIFGVSTGTLGAFLAEWQPALIGISLLTFGYSFYSLYFKKKQYASCHTGEECECPSPHEVSQKKQKIFLWAALVLSIVFYAYPLFEAESSSAQEIVSVQPQSDKSLEASKLSSDSSSVEKTSKSCSSGSNQNTSTKASCSGNGNKKASCSSAKKTSCSGK